MIGDNGAGKTNLLEALYYLEIFRSFRGAPDEQLVRFGADAFYVRARFQEGAGSAAREISAAYEPRTRRKRVTVDGGEPDRLGDAIGQLAAVVFSPSDVSIITGAPGERRRFLDIVLSLNEPGYLAALQTYRQVLRQRNAILKSGTAGVGLAAWDAGLIEWGSRLTVSRARWIDEHADAFARRCREIGGGVPVELRYRPALRWEGETPRTLADATAAFEAALHRVGAREREQRVTLAGPHRDDLAMVTDGSAGEIDLRDYGSGGQVRTAAVALRIIEADTIRSSRGRPPMMLLDDVFAELDAGRSRRVVDLLEAGELGQVFLTAPRETDLGLPGGFTSALEPWRIENGRVLR